MKFKKLICTLSCLLMTLAFSFGNEKLDNDLSYLKRVLSEAYVGYEYNVEQGFDFDEAIENVRNLYLKKAVENQIDENELSDDLLAECINSEIVTKLKVPDKHFQIATKKIVYGFNPQIWYSSKIFFKKNGDDYYVVSSRNFRIRRKSKYTGNVENLFKVIKSNKEYYVFGVFSKKTIEKAEISINNKTYTTKVRIGNYVKDYYPGHLGMKKTKKTLYLSISDCLFNGTDRTDYAILAKKFQNHIHELRTHSFENVIIDLRHNPGGAVKNITPILSALNFEGDYKNSDKVGKKLSTFDGGKFKYSNLIDEAIKGFKHDNPAYDKFIVEDSTTEYRRNNRVTEYDFEPAYKGKLILICDFNSASASENFIAYSYIFENVYLIGTNSSGTIDFGGLYDYYLPESGVGLHLASVSFKESDYLQKNPHWHGDTKGFYPDYWCTDNSLLPTLVAITKDKKLKKSLRGLHKQLL